MRPTSALSKRQWPTGQLRTESSRPRCTGASCTVLSRGFERSRAHGQRRPGRSSRSSSPTSTASTSPGPTPLGRQSRIGEPCNSESGGIWESLGTLRLSRTLISSRSDGARRCSSKTNAAGEHFSIITTTSRGSRSCTRQSSKTWSIRSRKFSNSLKFPTGLSFFLRAGSGAKPTNEPRSGSPFIEPFTTIWPRCPKSGGGLGPPSLPSTTQGAPPGMPPLAASRIVPRPTAADHVNHPAKRHSPERSPGCICDSRGRVAKVAAAARLTWFPAGLDPKDAAKAMLRTPTTGFRW